MNKDDKSVQLTDDPLTNIYAMVPMLNEKAREAVSYLMYGFYLGEKLSDTKEPFRGEENQRNPAKQLV